MDGTAGSCDDDDEEEEEEEDEDEDAAAGLPIELYRDHESFLSLLFLAVDLVAFCSNTAARCSRSARSWSVSNGFNLLGLLLSADGWEEEEEE